MGLISPAFASCKQRLQALASRDNGEFLALLLHDKVLLQAVRPDAGGEFLDEALILRLADVALERDELVEGDFGSVVVMVVLLLGFGF